MAIGVRSGISARRQFVCALVESAIFAFTYMGASLVRLGGDVDSWLTKDLLVTKSVVAAAVFGLSFYYHDLYDNFAFRRRLELFLRVSQAFAAGTVLLTLLFYVVPPLEMSRSGLLFYVPTALFAVLVWRGVFVWAYA